MYETLPNKPTVYSFVSGKGGVGKTSIAANYAWVSAQSRKTIIVDLDLQNQGLTGLLERFTDNCSFGAFELLSNNTDTIFVNKCLIEVSPNLWFLPATSSNKVIPAVDLANLLSDPAICASIQSLMRAIKDYSGYEVLILDCHGGLDYLSLGANNCSDVTIVVTEADTVTFNGTLELLSFYRSIPQELEKEMPVNWLSPPRATAIMVNRIPPKYRFVDLERSYKSVISRMGSEYGLAPDVLAFLPQEDFLMSAFGEYPFCAELAPKSVFTEKLWLVDFILSDGNVRSRNDHKLSRKIGSAKFRIRIMRCITSNETRNTERMLSAFGVLTVGFTLYVLTLLPAALLRGGVDPLVQKTIGHETSYEVLAFGTSAMTALILWSLSRAMWGATKFYTDRYTFKLRLWTALGRSLRFAERVILGRLLLLRFALFCSFIFFCFVFVLMLIMTPYYTVMAIQEPAKSSSRAQSK